MSSNPIPVSAPERPYESLPGNEAPATTGNQEKTNTRFVIKLGGIIPV